MTILSLLPVPIVSHSVPAESPCWRGAIHHMWSKKTCRNQEKNPKTNIPLINTFVHRIDPQFWTPSKSGLWRQKEAVFLWWVWAQTGLHSEFKDMHCWIMRLSLGGQVCIFKWTNLFSFVHLSAYFKMYFLWLSNTSLYKCTKSSLSFLQLRDI